MLRFLMYTLVGKFGPFSCSEARLAPIGKDALCIFEEPKNDSPFGIVLCGQRHISSIEIQEFQILYQDTHGNNLFQYRFGGIDFGANFAFENQN